MLTAIVLTKNEEKNITECLKSLDWCDEKIVIDDYSKDKTVALAKKLGAKVYQRHLGNDFASQRNFGLKLAKNEWILFVDADERVTPALQAEMFKCLNVQMFKGYYLKRKDYFGGRWLKYGENSRVKLLRLAKKSAGQWQRKVHETWQIKGKIGELKNPLLHYPHSCLTEFLEKINFYSDLHAQVLYENKVKTNLFWIMAKPLGKFLKNYFFNLGFLDGMPGLIMALMMSWHSFFSQAKLFLKWRKT